VIQVRRPDRSDDGEPGRFRPGDLVRHRRYDYRGVVVALDASCGASEAWYRSNRTQPRREQPWYHVLVHGSGHSTYAAEENLTAEWDPAEILHPLVPRYFSAFVDGGYLRNDRPWEHGNP
jgi:heat shock protein HspQ